MTLLNLLYTHEILIQVTVTIICTNLHRNALNIDPTIQLKTFKSYVKNLEEIVTIENTALHSILPHINSLLHNAVLTCKATMSQGTATMSSKQGSSQMFESEKIAPNKKLDHQWRFKPTTKAPGRKKTGLVLRLE